MQAEAVGVVVGVGVAVDMEVAAGRDVQRGPATGESSSRPGKSLWTITSSKLTNSGPELMELLGSSAMSVPSTAGRLLHTLDLQRSHSC